MKKYISLFLLCMLVMPAFGAGRSMSGANTTNARAGHVATAGRAATVATNATANATGTATATSQTKDEQGDEPAPANRDAEKLACLRNNIGIGNTFVWASRNSNTANYATMVEDTVNPENNVCFVLVGMRSDDSAVNTSDIQPRYFEWGQNITCGSWIDEDKMKERILDAKKKGRVWATIGASAAGAGVGVGAMELFGNKLIGGKVQGQKQYEEGSAEWYKVKDNEG